MLKDQIKQAMMQAMRDKRSVEKEVLRVALGEVQTEESRRGNDLADEETEKIVRKLIKSNLESMDNARSDEERQKLVLENETLDALLPKQLSVDEIIAALSGQVDAIKAAAGDGPATGIAMKQLKSTGAAVDGRSVSEAVRKIRTS